MKAASRKRHMEPDIEGTPKKKRGRPKKQNLEDRYPPMKGLSDDHITLSRNTSALHKELEMEKPRKEIIISLCNQTFMYRREEILKESLEITASALIEKFQELKILYVVS